MPASLRPLVLCGPSGSGKSTLMKRLTDEFPEAFGFSVSHTTRAPRPGEEDGVHYHFSTKEAMQTMIDAGEFIESATFSGNLYGTSKAAVEDVLRSGKICILDIDVQGVKSLKAIPDFAKNPLYVFVKPPSLQSLEDRLRARGTESEESLSKRLAAAAAEMEYGETEGNFDLVVVNDNVDEAYDILKGFLLPLIQAVLED